jgi:tRNA-2-methylthio-N6-dimethylallyladenosine synthase
MDLVREVNYAIAYSFKYSERPGTPAAEMFGQVPEDVKNERLQALQALLKEQQTAFNASKIGHTIPVFVTGKGRKEGQMHGRSPWLQAVHFDAQPDLVGQIIDVSIKGATLNSLSGELTVKSKEVAA